ncbi:MAG: hypothetical protein GX868_09105, partial [Actinobacteria bacterium]|nr:hypothetical protein [Actinomycetota bacterium]
MSVPSVTPSDLSSSGPHAPFTQRHIGVWSEDLADLVAEIGYDSPDALIDAVVPDSIRSAEPLNLPEALSETKVLDRLRSYAERNTVRTSMI